MIEKAFDSRDKESDARSGLALALCIERLESIIQAETDLLKQGGDIDFASLNARKSHALMEFIQASKGLRGAALDGAAGGVERLRHLLIANAEILERHLQATHEIATLMISSIRGDESDGTYTARRRGAR